MRTASTRRGSSALLRILALYLIVLGTAYGVFIGGAWAGIHSSALRTLTLAIIVVVLLWWGAAALFNRAWWPNSRILPALLLPLITLALTIAVSREPRLGLDYLGWSILLVAMYLLLVRLMASEFFRPRLVPMVPVLALVVGVWYLQQVVSTWIDWWTIVGRLAAPPLRPEFAGLTFGNPSAVMTVSIILTVPAVAFIGVGTSARRSVSIALLVLSAVVTGLSGSRAGWLGLTIGWTIATVLWLLPAAHRRRVSDVIRSPRLRVALAVATVVAVAIGAILLPGFLLRASAGGEGLRVAYWAAAIRMFVESPLFGTGPGTWVAQRIAYTDNPANDYYIPHAHNIYVQTLAETGVLGAAVGVVVVFVVGRLILHAVRSDDSQRVAVGWATTFALAYFAGHQLLDFYPNFPGSLIAMALPIAWLDAAESRSGPRPVRSWAPASRAGAGAFAVTAIVAAVGFLGWSEHWASVEAQAVAAINDGRDGDALPFAREAASSDPGVTSYWVTLGLAESRAGTSQQAAEAFQRAADGDDLPDSWLGLAAAKAQLGDAATARTALDRALRLGVTQPAILVGAADVYARLGDFDSADKLIVTAIQEMPGLARDAELLGLEPERTRRAQILDSAIRQAGATSAAVAIALEAGRPTVASTIIDQLQEPDRSLLTLVAAAWRGDDEALVQLRTRAAAAPLEATNVVWLSRLAARRGDTASVAIYREWFLVIYGNSVWDLNEVRTARSADPADSLGSNAAFYGHYTYRRPTPWNLISGDLLRIVSP